MNITSTDDILDRVLETGVEWGRLTDGLPVSQNIWNRSGLRMVTLKVAWKDLFLDYSRLKIGNWF